VMPSRQLALLGLMTLLALAGTGPAHAGPYTDDMAKCLVSSSSQTDRKIFMKWLFSAMAQNPEVRSMTSITLEQRDRIDKGAAALIQKLLTVSCRQEVVRAATYEVAGAIQASFQVFGQVAGRELMANQQVAEAMGRMGKLIDSSEMAKLTAEASPQ
jgi:hypothetical protein